MPETLGDRVAAIQREFSQYSTAYSTPWVANLLAAQLIAEAIDRNTATLRVLAQVADDTYQAAFGDEIDDGTTTPTEAPTSSPKDTYEKASDLPHDPDVAYIYPIS